MQSNGVAAGPQIATGTQVTIDQAFDRASSLPGDASIVESMWLQHALSDGIYDQPVVDSDRQIRLISEFTVTEATLDEQLGPHWADVVTVVERFARGGFDDYIDKVRESPPMRVPDALQMRVQLQRQADAAGLGQQWELAQGMVTNYFETCNAAALGRRDVDEDLSTVTEGWVLAEALARDAVAAAFAGNAGSASSPAGVLASGLGIVLDPGAYPTTGSLTKNFDPNENLSAEDRQLLEAEEPTLGGP